MVTWLKGRGMRKDDFLTRFCRACLKLCIFNLLVLIFLFCSANKIKVLFFPFHPPKYFLCSLGSYILDVQLSVWMCNSLSCMTMQLKLTFQFGRFLHLESSRCIIFLVSITSVASCYQRPAWRIEFTGSGFPPACPL